MTTVKEYFGISCPEGGDFYICESDSYEFVGCCTSDPCSDDGECPINDLRVMTFQQNMYEELPPQLCPSNDGSAWYSCKFTEPPFLGCCINNPCDTGNFPDGCGRENLTQGRLAEDDSARFSFYSLPLLATETGSATAQTKTSSTTSTTATDTNTIGAGTGSATTATETTVAPEAPDEGSDHGLSTATLAGIILGSVIVPMLCIGILMYRCGWSAHSRRNKRLSAETGQHRPLDTTTTPQMSPYQGKFPLFLYRLYLTLRLHSFQYSGGYYDQHGKYHSPLMTQHTSPDAMYVNQSSMPGAFHNQQPSGSASFGLGMTQVEPQELPAQSVRTPELAADGDRANVPNVYGTTPDAMPQPSDGNARFSPNVAWADRFGDGRINKG